jgi:hypothetical protein
MHIYKIRFIYVHFFVLLHKFKLTTCLHYIQHKKFTRFGSLTFVGPCIVIHFYSKTNQMYNILNLFYFETLYMFWTVFPSIIMSLRLYIQHQIYVIQVL